MPITWKTYSKFKRQIPEDTASIPYSTVFNPLCRLLHKSSTDAAITPAQSMDICFKTSIWAWSRASVLVLRVKISAFISSSLPLALTIS